MALDENAARSLFEHTRWPRGPVCPHCGSNGPTYPLRSKPGTARPVAEGVRKCAGCRRRFTVTTGTMFSGSHVPLSSWLVAIELIASRCGAGESTPSVLEIKRRIGLKSYRPASLLCRRIRWGMGEPPFSTGCPETVEEAVRLLLQVKPSSAMPRPGTRRQQSVWAEIEAEFGPEDESQ